MFILDDFFILIVFFSKLGLLIFFIKIKLLLNSFIGICVLVFLLVSKKFIFFGVWLGVWSIFNFIFFI